MHAGEARRDRRAAAHELARVFDAIRDAHVDVCTDRESLARAPRGGERRLRLAHFRGDPLGIGADAEREAFGMVRRHRDHSRAGARDVHGHLGQVGHVGDEPTREAVAIDDFPAQVALQPHEERLERGERRGLLADVRERRVAAPDPERHAPVRFLLQRVEPGGHERDVARYRIRHAGAEPDPLRRRDAHRELDEGFGGQTLSVGDQEAVPAGRLGELGDLRGAARDRPGQHPEFRHRSSPTV